MAEQETIVAEKPVEVVPEVPVSKGEVIPMPGAKKDFAGIKSEMEAACEVVEKAISDLLVQVDELTNGAKRVSAVALVAGLRYGQWVLNDVALYDAEREEAVEAGWMGPQGPRAPMALTARKIQYRMGIIAVDGTERIGFSKAWVKQHRNKLAVVLGYLNAKFGEMSDDELIGMIAETEKDGQVTPGKGLNALWEEYQEWSKEERARKESGTLAEKSKIVDQIGKLRRKYNERTKLLNDQMKPDAKVPMVGDTVTWLTKEGKVAQEDGRDVAFKLVRISDDGKTGYMLSLNAKEGEKERQKVFRDLVVAETKEQEIETGDTKKVEFEQKVKETVLIVKPKPRRPVELEEEVSKLQTDLGLLEAKKRELDEQIKSEEDDKPSDDDDEEPELSDLDKAAVRFRDGVLAKDKEEVMRVPVVPKEIGEDVTAEYIPCVLRRIVEEPTKRRKEVRITYELVIDKDHLTD